MTKRIDNSGKMQTIDKELTALKNSKSWKWTYPCRIIYDFIFYFDDLLLRFRRKKYIRKNENIVKKIIKWEKEGRYGGLYIVLIGHNASRTGAPIILLELIRKFVELYSIKCLLILKEGGVLLNEYQKTCDVIVLSDFNILQISEIEFIHSFAEQVCNIKENIRVIANTVVTHDIVEIFAQYDFKQICLVHELPESIDVHFGGAITMRKIARFCGKLIFPTKIALNDCKGKYLLPSAKLELNRYGIKYSIDLSLKEKTSREVRDELRVSKSSKIFIGCGSIEPRKGVDYFIATAKRIIDQYSETNSDVPYFIWIGNTIPGNDEYFKSLHSSIKSDKYTYNIKFLGEKSCPEKYIMAANVFLFTSRLESLGLVALESIASGTPVVIFDGKTGVQEFVKDLNVSIVPSFDIEKYANAAVLALDANIDFNLYCAKNVRSDYSLSKYCKKIHTSIEMDSKGLCDSMLFNKSVLIIGYAPPPLLGLRTEGGGLRNWGLAKGIKNNIPEYHVYYAYNTTLDDVLPDGVYEGISVFKWSDSNLEELIYQCSTIVLSYCMGSDTTKILQYVNNSQQVILDCYVPIYTEVSSRNASNSNLEYKDYQNSLHHWNNSFKRANVLVCANKHQENFYTGVLSALGVLNPLTYNNIRIRIIPYGIDNTQPDPKRTPISDLLICTSNTPFKLLWFGGIYPWFDVTILIDAMKILRDKHNIVLTMVGIQNPFITNPDFLKTVENVKKKIELENISDVINIHEWVDYESRADWYLDSDIIITINKPGIENEFAWRTRLVDYVWSGIPVLTNGNDPLGELLIKYGAAARCDIESAETLAESIQRLIIDKESLRKMSQRMKEYRPKLYWDKLVKPIVSDIIKHENYVALRN